MKLRLANVGDGSGEVFYALQGEGPRAGRPSTFVRLAACNLWCVWCDTPYTWRFTDAHPHTDDVVFQRSVEVVTTTAEAVADRVAALGCPSVVLTGGEPLLQDKALVVLLTLLRERAGVTEVDFETNGTLVPSAEVLERTDLFVVSPKLANSEVPLHKRITPALESLAATPKATFKFVVSTQADLEEVDGLVARLSLAPRRVFLMPEGRSSEALRAHTPWVASACLERGYQLSDRLHVHLSGDTRGT